VAVVAAAVAGVAIAGCGGSNAPGAGARVDPALKMAQCMRAHGVPGFPDPSGGGPVVIPNGINADAPAFQSAQRACNKLLPGGQPGGRSSESAKLAMLAMARCIRAHGVPNFPDPTTGPPASPPAQGLALGRGGEFLVVADPQAPAFKHAAAICHFPMPHLPSG
jgi:hypothetical protein